MTAPIHLLTHPGDPTASTVVCGATTAALATWDVQRVTCPHCRVQTAVQGWRPGPSDVPQPRRRVHMSEKAVQTAVTEALTRAGWVWYHTHDSRHSPAGFPDVVALKGPRCLVLELKSATGLVTPAQQTWLAAWRRILGAEVHVVRPADLDTLLEVFR